jgi:hypothetical protein
VVTDSGNFILDCHCQSIANAPLLETELNRIPGVVENGLFTREAAGMVVGCFDGTTHVRLRRDLVKLHPSGTKILLPGVSFFCCVFPRGWFHDVSRNVSLIVGMASLASFL